MRFVCLLLRGILVLTLTLQAHAAATPEHSRGHETASARGGASFSGRKDHAQLDYTVWTADSSCPNDKEFRALLRERVGYELERDGVPLKVAISVVGRADGLEGRVRWTGADGAALGERRLTARGECSELAATLAFIVSVQLPLMVERSSTARKGRAGLGSGASSVGPSDTASGAPSGAASASGSGAPVRAPAAARSAPSPPDYEAHDNYDPLPDFALYRSKNPARWRVFTGAGPFFSVHVAPTPALQGRVFGGAKLGALSLEAAFEAAFPGRFILADGSGFEHSLLAATLALCAHPTEATSFCGLGRWGRLQVQGRGVDHPATAAGSFLQIGPRVAYWLRVSEKLSLAGYVGASLALSPWRVQLDGGAIWHSSVLGGVVGIDLLGLFP